MKFAGLCRWALLLVIALSAMAPVQGRSQTAERTRNAADAAARARSAAPEDAYTLPPDLLAKAVALDRIRNVLAFGGSLWGIAFLWLVLATRSATRLDGWTQRTVSRRWVQGLIFFALLLIAVFLAGLPFDWFAHYTSRAYGISVQSWPGWLRDEGVSLAISIAIGAPLLLFFNWTVRRWPRRFWFAAWLISLPLMLVAVVIQPLVIDPLFNKFEPLERSDPALVQQLEKVVQRTGIDIPTSRMFLMKASAKTNGLNAYVAGIGPSKRIVVWDTTAGRIPNDEILYIFAHESGHYVQHHIPKGLAVSAVSIFFIFWACAGVAAWLVRSRGPRWQIDSLSSRCGFVVLLFVLSVAGFVIEPAGNAVSRHFEHQADVYGQEAVHGIVASPQQTAVAAFNALGRAWLEDPHPNAFSEFWLDSHPSIQQRARFAAQYDPWKNGGHGRYFGK